MKIWVYCVRCREPCEAFVDDERDEIEWYVTCRCRWANETCGDKVGLNAMEEKAREAVTQGGRV